MSDLFLQYFSIFLAHITGCRTKAIGSNNNLLFGVYTCREALSLHSRYRSSVSISYIGGQVYQCIFPNDFPPPLDISKTRFSKSGWLPKFIFPIENNCLKKGSLVPITSADRREPAKYPKEVFGSVCRWADRKRTGTGPQADGFVAAAGRPGMEDRPQRGSGLWEHFLVRSKCFDSPHPPPTRQASSPPPFRRR